MTNHDGSPKPHGAPGHAPAPGASQVVMPHGSDTVRTSIFLPPLLPGQEAGPQLPSALSAAPTAQTLWAAFMRRWPQAIGLGLAAALLGIFLVMFVLPSRITANQYFTDFVIRIDSGKQSGLVLDKASEADFQVAKLQQAAYLKTRQVINRALEMDVRGRFVKDMSIVRREGDPVAWLQGVKTDFLLAPELMNAKFSSPDNPEELTLLMNALAKSLVEESRIAEEKKHSQQIEHLNEKMVESEKLIAQKRKLLSIRMPDGGGLGKRLEQLELEIAQIRGQKTGLHLKMVEAQNLLNDMTERINNPQKLPSSLFDDAMRQDPQGMTILKDLESARKDFSLAQQRLPNPDHPELQRYRDRVDAAQRAREDYLRQMRGRPDGPVEGIRAKVVEERDKAARDVRTLQEQLRTIDEHITKLEGDQVRHRQGALPVDVQALFQEVDTLAKAHATLQNTLALLKANQPPPRISVLQEAIEPAAKDTGRMFKLAGAGSLGLFLLTALGVSYFEFRSRKISGGAEVSRGLGMHLIGSIPALPDKARSPLAHGRLDPHWQAQIMESVDTIRTMLLHSARSNNTRVIMVTSAVTGEGKTSLASQLAASLARAWKKTLLIDGDLRSPAAHRLFDVPQDPGFSEVLRGELSPGEAVRSTPLSRLWVMPAGHWDAHAVQALAQDNVRSMLEELKQTYDFIVIDSSPILPVADGLLLGQNVDGVLMSVMRDVSRSPAVYAAQQRLEGLGIKTIGAVLIGSKDDTGSAGFRYGMQPRAKS